MVRDGVKHDEPHCGCDANCNIENDALNDGIYSSLLSVKQRHCFQAVVCSKVKRCAQKCLGDTMRHFDIVVLSVQRYLRIAPQP